MKKHEATSKTILSNIEKMDKDVPKQLRDIWEKIMLLASLLAAYFSGRYTQIKYSSIVLIIGALIYLFTPFDVVFDGIPFFGFSDDIALLTKMLDSIIEELELFAQWKKSEE